MKYTLRSAALGIMMTALPMAAFSEANWGEGDQIGAANRITQESVLAATQLVTEGKTYALGMIIDSNVPSLGARQLSVTVVQPDQAGVVGAGPTETSYNDDIFNGWLGIGSQIDGLGHVGRAHEYYNGNKLYDFAKPTGLIKLGIENIPPIVTRGVMLDIADLKGQDILDAGVVISAQDIQDAAKAQDVALKKGDVVLLHTGWLSLLTSDTPDPARYGAGEPGIDPDAARYLADIGVIAVGADTWGVEAVPFAPGAGVYEAHQVLLKDNGIYILENMMTEQLAADEVYEFMFSLGVTRLRGAVQMMVNPVAIK